MTNRNDSKNPTHGKADRGDHDSNPDPITGSPGSHPAGTGIGAASGAATGAAVGMIGGPVGAMIGGVAGAVVGGLVGHGIGEAVDPTEDNHWRENYKNRPYASGGDRDYDDYEPAYRLGYNAYDARKSDYDDSTETALAGEYDRRRGDSRLDWDDAKHAVRDAYERRKAGAKSGMHTGHTGGTQGSR